MNDSGSVIHSTMKRLIQSTWRGNRFAFPLPTVARTSSGLPASPSRLGPATKGAYPLGSPDDRFPAASRRAYQPIVNAISARKKHGYSQVESMTKSEVLI